MAWEALKKMLAPVRQLTAADLRRYLDEHDLAEFQLLDVRQPKEYNAAHLAGAILIPLKELLGRSGELDPAKPVIVYCASGQRSLAAARLLAGKGFQEVYNLQGGIKAWQGGKAAGPADLGLELFADLPDLAAAVQRAWAMEDGLQRFYRRLEAERADPAEKNLFHKLAAFENIHKKRLQEEYRAVAPAGGELGGDSQELMEGGRRIDDQLKRATALIHTVTDILHLAMALETQALDLYSRLARGADDEQTAGFFQRLAAEEKGHLAFLSDELDRLAG